jgi:hypothetical protein
VLREDGTELQWDDIVAPVNLLGAVMWKSVEVRLNGQSFGGTCITHAGYKAFIETLLSYDADSRNTHLHSQFFFLDSPGEYNNMQVPRDVIKKNLIAALESGKEASIQEVPVVHRKGDNTDAILAWARETARAAGRAEPTRDDILNEPGMNLSEEAKYNARIALYETQVNAALNAIGHLFSNGRINRGFEQRFRIVNGSASFDMYVPITHDFFKLNNHVGPGNKIDITLDMYPSAFLLNSYLNDRNYKIYIDDMKLHLRTIERKERIAPPLEERYFMNQTEMHNQLVQIYSPQTTFRIHNGGVMPKTVIMMMVNTKASEGTLNENPFQFHHYYVNKMQLIINGEPDPVDGIRTDFTKPNVMCSRAYRWLFENTGAADSEKGNIIAWPAFQAGSFIMCWDLTPDKCNGLHNHNANYGYIDMHISFDRPLDRSIFVYYELVFPKVVVNNKVTNTVAIFDVEA